MKKLNYSYVYIIALSILFVVVIYTYTYVKNMYYNAFAEKALKKIVMFELITFSKENYYIPIVVNVKEYEEDYFQKMDDLINNKHISAVVKVSKDYNSFVAVVKHKDGNRIYGVDSDYFKVRFKYSRSGYSLKTEDCPSARKDYNDLRGWIYKERMKIDIPLIQY